MEKFHVELNQPIFKGYIDDPLEEYVFKKTLDHQRLEGVEEIEEALNEALIAQSQHPYGNQKIGRNDPCLCGSGKKYKKCCIELDATSVLESATFEDVKKFPVHKVLEQLETYGIRLTRAEFVILAQKNTPREIFIFWDLIAEGIVPRSSYGLRDRLYLQNAIKLLIDRLCPSLSYYQKWEENLKIAYSHLDVQDEAQGIYHFSKAWEIIKRKITPSMLVFEEVDEVLLLEEPFSNFVNDYEISFTNSFLLKKEYRQLALQFCKQILNQFTEEDPSQLEHLQLTQARCHLFESEEDEAEMIYQAMITRYPKRAAGYVGWIDSLTWLRTFMKKDQDPDKANLILQQARKNGVEDGDSWDLEKKMNDM